MSTIKTKYGEYIASQVLDDFTSSDILFRFEFDEGYFINSISIRAESFDKAINQFTLILHESSLNYVSFIHKIS